VELWRIATFGLTSLGHPGSVRAAFPLLTVRAADAVLSRPTPRTEYSALLGWLTQGCSVSLTVVVVLVLLPVFMYALALGLAAARTWLGISGIPRARNVVRAVRQGRAGRREPRDGAS